MSSSRKDFAAFAGGLLDVRKSSGCLLLSLVLFVFVFHVAARLVAVVFGVVLGFHVARIAAAAGTAVLCFGTTRTFLFHRARIAVATTRIHRATSFSLLLLVALCGGLGHTGRSSNQ
jgi:hypothetical protein